jgi:hypothetical protein
MLDRVVELVEIALLMRYFVAHVSQMFSDVSFASKK